MISSTKNRRFSSLVRQLIRSTQASTTSTAYKGKGRKEQRIPMKATAWRFFATILVTRTVAKLSDSQKYNSIHNFH